MAVRARIRGGILRQYGRSFLDAPLLAERIHYYTNGYPFLLIFDFSKSKQYKTEAFQFAGKDLFAVWV